MPWSIACSLTKESNSGLGVHKHEKESEEEDIPNLRHRYHPERPIPTTITAEEKETMTFTSRGSSLVRGVGFEPTEAFARGS